MSWGLCQLGEVVPTAFSSGSDLAIQLEPTEACLPQALPPAEKGAPDELSALAAQYYPETSDSERLGGPCPSDAQSPTAIGSTAWTALHLPCLSL